MSDFLSLFLMLCLGGMLGIIFFGGLWWTILKSVSSKCPAPWFAGSMLLRTGIALAGFYYFSQGHWERLLACLVGFFFARAIVLRATHLERTTGASLRRENNHAH